MLARDRPSPYGEVPFFIVVRGPVPRERWSARTMARDRPSPYDGGGLSASAAPVDAPPYCIDSGKALLPGHRSH